MKVKKDLILLLAVIIMASAAACGGGSSNAPTTSSAPSGNKAPAGDGKVYEFMVQNHDPASSICGQYLEAWGSKITEASNGQIKFTFYHGGSLGSAAESVEMVENGQADLCWSSQGIYTGRFPVSEGIMLPMNGVNSARMGSKILMDMLREMPEMQKEYEAFKVVQLSACTYSPISLTKPPLKTAADLKGLRIRVASKTVGMFMENLGVSPMTVATPETYESLEKNVIDGCINDWHNLAAFNLTEVIKSILDYPINTSPLMIIMNKDSYNRLPDDLKATFDKFCGDYASEMAGIYWDSTRAWVTEGAKEKGLEVYEPSQDILNAFAAVKDKTHANYIEYLNGYGIDGQKAYNKIMEIIARYADEYKDVWSKPVSISDFKG